MKRLVERLLPDSDRLRHLAYLPARRRWKARYGSRHRVVKDRYELYDLVNDQCDGGTGALTFLEFGVYKGDSIRYWANLNHHNDSRFIGFDTFHGLPESWDDFSRTVARSTFDTGGTLPIVDDSRVTFVPGLFQATLPTFLERASLTTPLVIHNDSDLYSATLFVLTCASPLIRPGTVVIFDEFYSLLHEFRALQDYSVAYMREYEVIGATKEYVQIAIRITR